VRLAQPVFSAISGECRGWYRKLISEMHYHLQEVGAEHVYLTTQAQNIPVLRTWQKLGYEYAKTERVLRKIVTSG
jgi:dTDP-4-amino-4,6-dideoxy-D-galactose acyltransferase